MNIETQKRRRKKEPPQHPFMTTAADLLQRHFQTLAEDNAHWRTLIADDVVWELPYAPAIGHPGQLSGRDAVVRHITWFVGAVEHRHSAFQGAQEYFENFASTISRCMPY